MLTLFNGSTVQIILALLIALVVYYLVVIWQPRYFTKLGVKGPFPWPVFGHVVSVAWQGYMKSNMDILRKYSRIAGVFEGSVPFLLISDPNILQQVMIKNFNIFPDRKIIKTGDEIVDTFLTSLKGDHWRHVRHTLTPTFSTGKLKQMMPEINECSKTLVENLIKKATEGHVINMKDSCGEYTMDVIARTAFGIEIDSQKNPNSPFVVYVKKFFQMVFSFRRPIVIIFFFFPKLAPILYNLGFTIFPQDSMDFFKDVCRKAYHGRKNEKEMRTDFLQLMINAHNEKEDDSASALHIDDKLGPQENSIKWNKQGLTETEIIAQSVVFLIAGYETTAAALSFLTYCLALYPECQEKLYQEVVHIVGNNTFIDIDTANKLVYLDQCIQETLRMYPPAVRVDREVNENTIVANLNLPKGLYIGIQIYNLHHDPLLWPEPDKFEPERFSPEAVVKHHPLQYLPFGAGPRMCIGMRLALIELKVATIHLIQKYRFIRCEETEVPLQLDTGNLLLAKNGIKLKLELRK